MKKILFLFVVLLLVCVYGNTVNDNDYDSFLELYEDISDDDSLLSREDIDAIKKVESLNNKQPRFEEETVNIDKKKKEKSVTLTLMKMKKAVKKGKDWLCETDSGKEQCPYENGMCCVGGPKKTVLCCRHDLYCYTNSTNVECLKLKTATEPPHKVEIAGMSKHPLQVTPHPGNPPHIDIKPHVIVEHIHDGNQPDHKPNKNVHIHLDNKNKIHKKHK